MKTAEEFVLEIKEKNGDQISRDGRMIRDIDDRELLKKVLERYPGERENIIDLDEYLGEETQNLPEPPPKSDIVQKMEEVKKSPSFMERIKNRAIDTAKDIGETAMDIGGTVVQGAKDIKEIANREDINLAQKFAATAGEVGSTASEAVGEAVIGAGKVALSQEHEDQVKQLVQDVAGRIAENDTVQQATQKFNDWYNGLDKDNKLIVDSIGGIGSFMAEVLGLGVAGKAVKPTLKAVGEAGETVIEAGKEAVETGIKKIDEITEPVRKARAEKAKIELEDTVKRITQAVDKTDIDSAKATLTRIDVEDVNNYKDFTNRITDDIAVLSDKVDAELSKYPEKYKPDQLGRYSKVGDETVITSPVQDALDGLEHAYKLSGDAVGEAKIRQLRQKLDSDGLNVKELNNLAREYGTEFKDKAFDKLGNPKQGYNAENYESVRKGVKQVARDRMPDDVVKELDEQISDSYTTRELIKKIEQEVAKAENKVRNYTLPQKIGRGIYSLADIATVGTLTGLVSRLNLKAGKMFVNRLELQEELVKNLKKLENLNKETDPRKVSEMLEQYIDVVDEYEGFAERQVR